MRIPVLLIALSVVAGVAVGYMPQLGFVGWLYHHCALGLYERGKSQFDQRQFIEAQRTVTSALQFCPLLPEAHMLKAVTHDFLGEDIEAINEYNFCITQGHERAYAYRCRANIQFKVGDTVGAIQGYNKAIERYPKDFELYLSRARAWKRLNAWDCALMDCDSVLQLVPGCAEALVERGNIRSCMHNPDGAINDYNSAIKENAYAYSCRGMARTGLGDHIGALRDQSMQVKLNPNSDCAYEDRGYALFNLGRYAESIRDFDQALLLNPISEGAYWKRGQTRLKMGDLKGALRDLDKALALDPQDDLALNQRGQCKFRLGDRAGAKRDLEQALKLYPNWQVARFLLKQMNSK